MSARCFGKVVVMSVEVLGLLDRDRMRAAGSVAAEILEEVCSRIRVGTSSAEVEQWVRVETQKRGARPSQLGYRGFPAAVCVSRNECVCHGIPSPEEIFQDGDVVNVDVTSELGGFHGDTSKMVIVGSPSSGAGRLVDVAKLARNVGISKVGPGARLGDVAAAVRGVAAGAGMSVVRELGGHGIGRKMHQEPHVSFATRAGRGLRLRAGMCITVEPMINAGDARIVFGDDGWRVSTADGSWSAQFEHTILVTENGAEVLT